jgi:hypothetical protein
LPSAPPSEIHPDRWRVLVPDFRASAAVGPGLALDGILVFPADNQHVSRGNAAPDASGYGAKGRRAKEVIAADRARLEAIPSLRKRAAAVVRAAGCSETTARNALRDEGLA